MHSNERWTLGPEALSSVVFSRDGRTIIVTSEDGTRLLEANSGKEIAMPGGRPAALSPDGYTAVALADSRAFAAFLAPLKKTTRRAPSSPTWHGRAAPE